MKFKRNYWRTNRSIQYFNLIALLCRKPLVGSDYVCFYKKSVLVHPMSAGEQLAMWEKVHTDHNCDTFYFSMVKFNNNALVFLKNLFRL